MPRIEQPRSPITGEILTADSLEIAAQEHGIDLASTSVGRMFDMGVEKLAAKKRQASLTRKPKRIAAIKKQAAEGDPIQIEFEGKIYTATPEHEGGYYIFNDGSGRDGLCFAYDDISHGVVQIYDSGDEVDLAKVIKEGALKQKADNGWTKTYNDPEVGDRVTFDLHGEMKEGICTEPWDESSDYCRVKTSDGQEEIVNVSQVKDVFVKTAGLMSGNFSEDHEEENKENEEPKYDRYEDENGKGGKPITAALPNGMRFYNEKKQSYMTLDHSDSDSYTFALDSGSMLTYTKEQFSDRLRDGIVTKASMKRKDGATITAARKITIKYKGEEIEAKQGSNSDEWNFSYNGQKLGLILGEDEKAGGVVDEQGNEAGTARLISPSNTSEAAKRTAYAAKRRARA